MLSRILDRCCRMFDHLIAALLAIMVILVFGNVMLRYGLDSGITLSEELARWLFVWMTFLGAIVALREQQHLGLESFTRRLGPAARRLCAGLRRGLMLGCCALLGIGAFQQGLINLGSQSAVMETSLAWLDGAVLVFALFACLILIVPARGSAGAPLAPDAKDDSPSAPSGRDRP